MEKKQDEDQTYFEVCTKYTLSADKCHNGNFKKLLVKSSEKDVIFVSAFYLIMCLMKSTKNFEKIEILKI